MVGDGNHCIDSTRERLAIIIEIIVQSIAVFFLLLQTFFFFMTTEVFLLVDSD